VVNSIWKRIWACCKIDYGMMITTEYILSYPNDVTSYSNVCILCVPTFVA